MSVTTLPPIRAYCPDCDEIGPAEYVETTTEDCCEGGARRRYECPECGFPHHRPGREP